MGVFATTEYLGCTIDKVERYAIPQIIFCVDLSIYCFRRRSYTRILDQKTAVFSEIQTKCASTYHKALSASIINKHRDFALGATTP